MGSSARTMIERQAAAQGFTVTSMEFEPISAGAEKAGTDGGWMVYVARDGVEYDAMGYNAAQVVQWIRNIDALDGKLTWRSDVFGCPAVACWKARGHRGEHVEDAAFAQRREARDASWKRLMAERAALAATPQDPEETPATNICPICERVIEREAHGGPHPSPGDHDPAAHVARAYGTEMPR